MEKYLPLVEKVAKKYYNSCNHMIEYEDLVQIGFEGLLKSLKTFDSSKGNFENYSYSYIRKYILNELGRNRGVITLPRNDYNILGKLIDNGELSVDDKVLAEKYGVPVRSVNLSKERYNTDHIAKLDVPMVGKDGAETDSLYSVVPSNYTNYNDIDNEIIIEEAICNIDERYKKAFFLYFEGYSQPEIAKIMDMSQGWVSRSINLVLEELRVRFDKDYYELVKNKKEAAKAKKSEKIYKGRSFKIYEEYGVDNVKNILINNSARDAGIIFGVSTKTIQRMIKELLV